MDKQPFWKQVVGKFFFDHLGDPKPSLIVGFYGVYGAQNGDFYHLIDIK